MDKLFLTTKDLIPYVKEYMKDINTYSIVEINPKQSLIGILIEAGVLSDEADGIKRGFRIESEASPFSTFIVDNKTITILI